MPRWVWAVTGLLFGGLVANAVIDIVRHLEIPAEAVALREKFPYESLRSRLTYEHSSRDHDPGEESPLLFDEALERLTKIEVAFDHRDSRARQLSLTALHSREVGYFLKAPRNGLSRWGRTPTPDRLNYADPEQIPPDTPSSTDEMPGEGSLSSDQGFAMNDPRAPAPSFEELEQFHLTGLMSFVDPFSIGDVRNIDQVSGFVPHGFRSAPTIGDPNNKWLRAHDASETKSPPSVWKVARLELVSLLKFETPRVYVSESLPQMKQADDAKTRTLDQFEQEGLEALRRGEDLVTADRDDSIRMFGSLRAASKCLECHTGQRGKLLGAFSYELRPRAQPVTGKKPPEGLGD